ncbi:hypothetical protein HanXRQr2_Chr11g0495521 [Helianthus annuus]|uniref:Uncharacterized protein n=1 Tax=Helianthus annuus TaxID=4232 RepID=A0A9K3N0V6_HELAN|nr:hypothetical protein HanXRQr2_Chr11g0495521 [Helianthus annuus]KAJ0875532.1 hypothetical protein HanPSC8_Chr11g0477521 [Helianthus annuus]
MKPSHCYSEAHLAIQAHLSKAVFECLRAPHAQDFLLAIPIDGLGQHMSPVEYRTILKYRLVIPLFPVDEFIVESSRGSNTDMIWLGMSFLTYSGALVFLLRKRHPLIS